MKKKLCTSQAGATFISDCSIYWYSWVHIISNEFSYFKYLPLRSLCLFNSTKKSVTNFLYGIHKASSYFFIWFHKKTSIRTCLHTSNHQRNNNRLIGNSHNTSHLQTKCKYFGKTRAGLSCSEIFVKRTTRWHEFKVLHFYSIKTNFRGLRLYFGHSGEQYARFSLLFWGWLKMFVSR